jgi:hypothetical protein
MIVFPNEIGAHGRPPTLDPLQKVERLVVQLLIGGILKRLKTSCSPSMGWPASHDAGVQDLIYINENIGQTVPIRRMTGYGMAASGIRPVGARLAGPTSLSLVPAEGRLDLQCVLFNRAGFAQSRSPCELNNNSPTAARRTRRGGPSAMLS